MAVPADPSEDELARHWSLTPAELAVIAECRGADHQRRFALQLCVGPRLKRHFFSPIEMSPGAQSRDDTRSPVRTAFQFG
jgi:hypothetical protein